MTEGEHNIGAVQAAISTAAVGLLRDYTGRGPTSARAQITKDSVIVTLYNCLTKGERTMADSGQAYEVLAMRRQLQNTMKDDLIAMIEDLTGLKVVAFLSDALADPDVAVEVFLIDRDASPD